MEYQYSSLCRGTVLFSGVGVDSMRELPEKEKTKCHIVGQEVLLYSKDQNILNSLL